MDQDLKLFQHIFIDNKAKRTLFLLHGTGGSTDDFLFLNASLGKKYNLIALQGNIRENGMARFFKRHAFGVFDLKSIKEEVEKLKRFILAWNKIHNTTADNLFYLGYSNGANMLLAILFTYPKVLQNLVLLHPMLPIKIPKDELDLSRHKIFISIGIYDQMVSKIQRQELVEILTSCDTKLTVKKYQSGHEISNQEIKDVTAFLMVS